MTGVFACAFTMLFTGSAVAAAVPKALPVAESVLTPLQQRQSEQAVDRAVKWLALQQAADGSFPTQDPAKTGITGLCLLAFLSRGHLPAQGSYGEHITRAISFILATQRDDGCLTTSPPEGSGDREAAKCWAYNHAIAGLALCEAYGMADRDLSEKMRPAIGRARDFCLRKQMERKIVPDDRGGWRYRGIDRSRMSDMSVTSWHLLFLRSAKNAGIAVPVKNIDAALDYIERSFDPGSGVFVYIINGGRPITRAMVGAGIVSEALAGKHGSVMARAAGDWLLRHEFDEYNASPIPDRYFYSLFYATQGMHQLGGEHWRQFFPGVVKVLLDNQDARGSWIGRGEEAHFGHAYTTALAVLALDTPHQLLPIFQR
jgi:hypothetical protein